jgi:hypothetical protein
MAIDEVRLNIDDPDELPGAVFELAPGGGIRAD